MSDTIALACRFAGDPAAPPMVLLHGLGDDGGDWAPVLPGLAAGHRVHVLDLRGHGRSPRAGAYSFALMRDDVLAHLDRHGVGSCVLVGHSMGAVVAMLLVQSAPHRVSRLVLEDATVPWPGSLRRPPLDPPAGPTPYDFAAVAAIRAQLDDPDPAWSARVSTVTVPALIIGGADSAIPHELLADTAARMPDATLVTLAAGHYVHRDDPAGFLAAVLGFVGDGSAPAAEAVR